MLENLVQCDDIDWSRITAFHMDEYIGLDAAAPQRFGAWLQTHLFNLVSPGRVHLLNPDSDPALLAEQPIDMVCMGIGVNGHLAFNDPPVADFAEPDDVKIVRLGTLYLDKESAPDD